MTSDQIALLLLLTALLFMLVWGKWRYDIVALGALFIAATLGLVPQPALFTGFGNPATITVVLVLILSAALTRSGAVDYLTQVIEPVANRPVLHITVLTFLAAFLSMFMNNVGALALLMPIAIQSTTKQGMSPASVLMPLSFGSILGGLVTLIGTPPNLLISSYRQEVTGEAFGMFDFAPVGGGVAMVGIIFLLVIGFRLVRVRKQTAGLELFDVEKYLFEVKVPKNSSLIGTTLGELRTQLNEQNIDLLSLIHNKRKMPQVHRHLALSSDDLLMLQGSQEDVDKLVSRLELQLLSAESAQKEIFHSEDTQILEVVVAPNSRLSGRTVGQLRFTRNYGINLLAISREGTPYRNRLRDFRFRTGDVLLLHGETEYLQDAVTKLGAYPLAERQLAFGGKDKALRALAVFVVAIAMAGFNIMSIQLSLGLATVAMVALNIIPVREFYDGVDWPVVILLGAMIPIGGALETTGTTALLVDGLMSVTTDMSPVVILVLVMVITMTVSDVLNNAATAILMAPIAYSMAVSLGVNPDAFLMAVAIGASCAFLTPIGHQNNALIMGPGGYHFGDYWRIGLPLEVLIVCTATPLILIVWPL
ncbi:MAG: SLC13 family permease [Pseudohongiellaceae bacterium]